MIHWSSIFIGAASLALLEVLAIIGLVITRGIKGQSTTPKTRKSKRSK